jgi:carbonic anhydrase/acetyltransferase-like protein (isoleucine patch superfamily)
VLRGDNEPIVIGEGSNVQDGCVLHTDMGFPLTVGRELHRRAQGHPARLHHRRRGADRHGGDGDERRASSARGVLIGAGALVTEGKEIPDGALVIGAPGQGGADAQDLTRSRNCYCPPRVTGRRPSATAPASRRLGDDGP